MYCSPKSIKKNTELNEYIKNTFLKGLADIAYGVIKDPVKNDVKNKIKALVNESQSKITDFVFKKEGGLVVKSTLDAELKKINDSFAVLDNLSALISAYSIGLPSSIFNGLFENSVITSEINDYVKNNLGEEFDEITSEILKNKAPITSQEQKN